MESDNPFDSFIYAAKKYSSYMSEEAQKIKLEYLLKITRNLYERGLSERERDGIIVLVARLINLENSELREQYFNELKKLEGTDKMAEMTWIEERFYHEALNAGHDAGLKAGIKEGRKEGRREGLSEGIAIGEKQTLSAAIDFMRSNGMSSEMINNFKNSMLKN